MYSENDLLAFFRILIYMLVGENALYNQLSGRIISEADDPPSFVVEEGTPMDVIKVSGTSRTSAVAGAIAGVVREKQRAEVQAIGASAVNQAVKAVALARGYLTNDGYNIICIPEFVEVDIEGKIRTAIRFTVEPR